MKKDKSTLTFEHFENKLNKRLNKAETRWAKGVVEQAFNLFDDYKYNRTPDELERILLNYSEKFDDESWTYFLGTEDIFEYAEENCLNDPEVALRFFDINELFYREKTGEIMIPVDIMKQFGITDQSVAIYQIHKAGIVQAFQLIVELLGELKDEYDAGQFLPSPFAFVYRTDNEDWTVKPYNEYHLAKDDARRTYLAYFGFEYEIIDCYKIENAINEEAFKAFYKIYGRRFDVIREQKNN